MEKGKLYGCPERLRAALLNYLNARPHGEVRALIDALLAMSAINSIVPSAEKCERSS